MGSITTYLEAELLDHVLNNSAYSRPATVYLGLCTADPTDAATGASCNECANSGSYARKEITFGASSARKVTQDATVTFDEATGSWGTVSHWVVTDTATYGAGNVLAHGSFSLAKAVSSGMTPSVANGLVYVEFTAGEYSTYLADKLLDLAFNNTAYTPPSTYVALCTSTLSDSDTTLSGKEVANSGSYARKQVNPNGGSSPTWDLAVSGDPSYVDNGAAITFTTATGDWGTVVAVAICDSGSHNGGNMLFYDNGMTDTAFNTADTAEFAAAALVVQLS